MAHHNQIEFIKANRDLIKEPILLVGSKLYDFDQFDLSSELRKLGFSDITGIDIEEGRGVDFQVDITDSSSGFITENQYKFATVVCMEVLTNVRNPFKAAENVTSLLAEKGTVVLSECFIRKLSRMPVDYWRFSYDALKVLFESIEFIDVRARFSITRQKSTSLKTLQRNFDEISPWVRHDDETRIGFLIRKVHQKFFAKGVFQISRLFPEQTIFAVGSKK